ncbi:MAG: hypothetical protein WCO26_06010 [Deltaproteobacteria bacterium]
MKKRTVFLKKVSDELFGNVTKELTGRSRGVRMRETIERVLKGETETLVVLDFSGIGPVDFSWADEAVAKIVSRLWSNEYGERYLVLKGLTASQVENIEVALERKKLAALTTGPGGWRIIGSLNNYLAHTLNQVMKKKQLTLKELSEAEGIGMNTSGTRLLNLYKKRLVFRVEGPEGRSKELAYRGRQFVYRSLLS